MTRIRKAVITAAGSGTRQYPASQTVQKEMFPLVDVDGFAKPTVQLILEEQIASGIEEVCIIANPSNLEPIRRHFRGLTESERQGQFAGKEWAFPLSQALQDMAARLTFVVQETPEGFGHAVFQARSWVGDEPFLLALGDHIYFSETGCPCSAQVMAVFATHHCPVSSVVRVPESEIYRYGTVTGTPVPGTEPHVYQITRMAEKPTLEEARMNLRVPGLPEDQYLCFFGIHAFAPTIFNCLEHVIRYNLRKRGEIQLTTAQALLFGQEQSLISEIHGIRYDMGIPEGLIQTQIALALRSPFAAQTRAMLKPN